MSTCPQCGQENKEGARFCVKCGSQLEAPAQPPPPQQAEAPPQAAPPPVPPPQAAAPTPPQAAPSAGQPAAPAAYPPPTPPGGYTPSQQYAPQAAYPPAQPTYGAGAKTRGPLFWIGAGLVLVSGVLVLISSFMEWMTGPFGFGSYNGWDIVNLMDNKLFDYGSGYPLFSGLCSLIAGIIIVLIAVIMLVSRSKGLGVLAVIFSILALGMAVTNLTSIVRGPQGFSLSVGVGMYIFLIFSLAGLVGGGTAMAG